MDQLNSILTLYSEPNIVISDNYVINNVSIRCDGEYSCSRASSLIANNGGNIYLSGSGSAQFSFYYRTYNYSGSSWRYYYHYVQPEKVIKTVDDKRGNVYCNGYLSCAFAEISVANNVFCNGYSSCDEVTFSDVNNVYLYGYGEGKSDSYMKFDTIYQNVYCNHGEVCQYAQLNNIFGNIFGIGDNVLYRSTITNIDGYIIGIGQQALYASENTNIENVYCIGNYSCESSIMMNVTNVVASGYYNPLSNAIIVSGNYYNATLNVTVNLTETYNPSGIICLEQATCTINCQSDSISACEEVTSGLYGKGIFVVKYNNEDINTITFQSKELYFPLSKQQIDVLIVGGVSIIVAVGITFYLMN